MLELTDLQKCYASFQLGPVSLELSPGLTVLLGPSGSGKTTLLELIAGLRRPDKGTLDLRGQAITAFAPEKRQIGLVLQDETLFPHLSVRQNICYRQERNMEPILEFLKLGQIFDRHDVKTLSGGERKKVALARALAANPAALLLDEPLADLDARARRTLRQELKPFLSGLDIPVLFVTHDREEAAFLADRLLVMEGGQIVQDAPPREVFRKPKTRFVADFLGSENLLPGRVISSERGLVRMKVGESEVLVVGETQSHKVTLVIRPEELTLHRKKPPTTSARNSLKGRVSDIILGVATAQVVADGQIPLTALITRSALEELDLKEGDHIFLTFKATAAHIIDEESD